MEKIAEIQKENMKSNGLIEEVRKVAKNVYEGLGGGFRETVYRNAMAVELETEREYQPSEKEASTCITRDSY